MIKKEIEDFWKENILPSYDAYNNNCPKEEKIDCYEYEEYLKTKELEETNTKETKNKKCIFNFIFKKILCAFKK